MLGVMEDMLQYREYMAQALELARKGAGWVDPNPLVARMRSVWSKTMPTRTALI